MTPEEKKREYNRAYYVANAEKIKADASVLYHSKKQIPGFLENKNARERASYNVKMEDPGYREKQNARKLAEFHIRWEDLDFRDKVNARQLSAYHDKKQDPNFRMRRVLSNRLRNAIQGSLKATKTLDLLGCSIEFLCEHLQKQFVPGMTWENYGKVWHVDHILPCAEFHLQHSEEQEICFHWTNLQPLFARDNLSKSDKIL